MVYIRPSPFWHQEYFVERTLSRKIILPSGGLAISLNCPIPGLFFTLPLMALSAEGF